jgi:hypothetical protein
MESMIASDNSGPCLGIELKLWERAKISIIFQTCYTYYINYLTYINQF